MATKKKDKKEEPVVEGTAEEAAPIVQVEPRRDGNGALIIH